MTLTRLLLPIVFAITVTTQLDSMNPEPKEEIIELTELLDKMKISDYKRESYYPFIFMYFKKLPLPQELCAYIFMLVGPKLPSIRAQCLQDLREYLAHADDEAANQRGFVHNLVKSCSLDVSSTLLKDCILEAKITSEQLYGPQKRTAFHWACTNGDHDCVTVMITAEGNDAKRLLWIKDHLGDTSFFYATFYNHVEIVKTLITEAGEDALKLISMPCDDDKNTPFHVAAYRCNTKNLNLFISIAGKNSWKLCTTKNGKGQTALMHIHENQLEESIANMLQYSNPNIDSPETLQKIISLLFSEECGWKPKKKSIKEKCVIQ